MKIDYIILSDDIKHCKSTIKKLESNNECLECIESHKRLLSYMTFVRDSLKPKNRPNNIKYSKSQKRKKDISIQIEKLLYINSNLNNQDLINKLNISKANFYKNYSALANSLRNKYKSQSLF